MDFYWNGYIHKPSNIFISAIISIFLIIFGVNSHELFRNKNEEANFIQRIYDLSALVKQYEREDNLDKLCETLFRTQDFVQNVTGNKFYIEDAIYLDFVQF